MPPNALLQHLRDIHLPSPIGWFPLAWGWYVLLIFVLIISGCGMIWFWRYYRNGQAKREALMLLAEYEKNYQKTFDSQKTSAEIADLLKRVALVYYPRKQVASLHGAAWLNFLNQTGKEIDFFAQQEALLVCPYQPQHNYNLTELFQITRAWIKQRGKPCLS